MTTIDALDTEAVDEMRAWLATMAMRDGLRENPAAAKMEMGLIAEALFNAGARTSGRVRTVFHHLKTKAGLVYWPTAKNIHDAAKEVSGHTAKTKAGKGDRTGLSYDELKTLGEKVLPTARRWVVEYPAGHPLNQHGKQTLAYWGETA